MNQRGIATAVTAEPPSADADVEVLHNFYWTSLKEPHAHRRKEILRAHPEVKKLMGHEPRTKYLVALVVGLQLLSAYMLRDTDPLSLKFLAWAYVVGATATQNLYLAIHELSHNLAFKKPKHNRLFSIFANLPIGIPFAASFGPYHQLHHKFLGDEVYDTDVPTVLEAVLLSNVLGKTFFATFQIFFYALRPMMVVRIPITGFHVLNVVCQFVFDVIWIRQFGLNGFFYFLLSSFLAGSLHPCSGHFIAEHYLFSIEEAIVGGKVAMKSAAGEAEPVYVTDESAVKRPDVEFRKDYALETYSYYGILNAVTWNVGLHNEHHDFPFIAWSKLWELNRMCPEFYETLPKHDSWVRVLWDFIFKYDVTLYNRVRRVNKHLES
ncbi:AGR025Wp [Eremothecium gossypii ATCC 10895]|uniref:sphingolipid 4-desaturase n=1 Tax=Eremothecium gossypii (strain ATCC 10895 / CBS 109.51 / FGSC 9923 / NRRL Y-1056) TaxID=284811 RepID=Q750D0_EREGS|nr:AGR025Wp [Eremothecium gossypii ATCC 10895]AAS54514.2 AGR025Wp [Eremothecium gossypii ATCC 10895]AEY98846.1 FAGR025Wp [Eremothecium gossypii FDAG1]